MRYGRTLLAGLGWAGTLGGLALCVVILLSASVAFDGGGPDLKPRKGGVVRLPSVPDAQVPRVPLATPAPAAAGPPPPGIHDAGDTLGNAVDALTPRR